MEYTNKPMSDYDGALVFALKKWIADEINSMTDSGIYALCITLEGRKAVIGYNTESFAAGGRWDIGSWKCPAFSDLDSDPAVEGALDMWADFMRFDSEEKLRTGFFECAAEAVRQSVKEYIMDDRFYRNIPVVLLYDGMGERTAEYTSAANAHELLDDDFFKLCGAEK